MQPLFENRYTSTKEILREFYQKTYLKKQIIPLAILAAVCLFGIILVCIIYRQALTFGNWLIFILIPVFLIIMDIFTKNRLVKTTYARQLSLNQGKEMEVLIRVMPEEIELHDLSNGGVNHIAFTQIKKTLETKNLYLLMLKSKIAVIFQKGSFTLGTLEELKKFIKDVPMSLKSA
ncbi:MAG: YcxB family protein [Christensenellales bacterium]